MLNGRIQRTGKLGKPMRKETRIGNSGTVIGLDWVRYMEGFHLSHGHGSRARSPAPGRFYSRAQSPAPGRFYSKLLAWIAGLKFRVALIFADCRARPRGARDHWMPPAGRSWERRQFPRLLNPTQASGANAGHPGLVMGGTARGTAAAEHGGDVTLAMPRIGFK